MKEVSVERAEGNSWSGPQFVFKRLGEDRLYVTREELEELVKQAQELLANPPLDENT